MNEYAKKWVEALRSGEFKQGKYQLKTFDEEGNTRYCCLGVAEEVIDEAEEHQVFYVPSSGLNATFTYEDFDGNGNPLGTLFTLEAGAASSGNLNVVLRHEPQKPNNGTLGDAGGETDVSVTFNVNIKF